MAWTSSLAVPSSSSEALPTRRVTIWAWVSSGKNGRSDLRISPRLSNSRKRTQSGFSNVRWSSGTSLRRCSVVAASASPDLLGGGVGLALAGAEEGPAGHALGGVAGVAHRQVLRELQGGERGDHRLDPIDGMELLVDLLHVLRCSRA